MRHSANKLSVGRKWIVFLVLFLVRGVFETSDGVDLTPDERREGLALYTRIGSSGSKKTDAIKRLSPDQRRLLLETARSALQDEKATEHYDININGSSAVETLAMLGDEEGRRRYADHYLVSPNFGSQWMVPLNDPYMIGLIGEALFRNDPDERRFSDLVVSAGQEVARRDILNLLVNTGVFSDEIRRWAIRMQSGPQYIDNEGTAIMRQWFRVNEAALKAGDFKDVKPGTEPVRVAEKRPEKTAAVVDQATNTPSAVLPAKGVNKPAIQMNTAADNSWVKFVSGAVAVAFALGIIFFFSRKGRNRG